MMEEAHILVHKKNCGFLENILKNNSLGHAYLFIGPKGVGKRTVALWFAKKILREENIEKSQNFCQILDEKSIKIEEVRKLRHSLSLKNPFGRRRVIVIDDAASLTPEAQNAFLKIFEEPAKDVTYILLTNNVSRVLPTVLSRAQRVRFTQGDRKQIFNNLIEKGLEREDAMQIALFSRGCLREAERLSENLGEFVDRKNFLREVLSIFKKEYFLRFNFIKKILDQERNIPDFLTDFDGLIKDILSLKLGREDDVANRFLMDEMKSFGHSFSKEKLVEFLKFSGELRSLLLKNVNSKLALEKLMLMV
ncbi:MAG: hypothetical protein ACD_63C00084G0003 [uncultured bacterium]|nr:MAG: hypothetical protein ACD_63C00084G0003 [uncultured bacterium]